MLTFHDLEITKTTKNFVYITRKLQNFIFNLKFCSDPPPFQLGLVALLMLFATLKWESLYTLPWWDEFSYINDTILNTKWSYFLPWNYKPEYFSGHPLLQPLTYFLAFNLFDLSPFTAKLIALSFSLLCLFSIYKMTEAVFKCSVTALFSVVFTMFLPLFWFHSTLVLGHIPLMAFGFGTIYAFMTKKYKTFLFFSLGLATIRESALAFFLPLVFQSLLIPHQRKSFFYIVPSLLIFFSHFLIFFIRTGNWFAHPYTYSGLPHNPNPTFFNFSFFFERSIRFFNKFFDQFPYLFWLSFLFSFVVFIVFKMRIKHIKLFLFQAKQIFIVTRLYSVVIRLVQKKTFIPLSVCVLFFGFWISYPDYSFRNFFPILIIFIPLSVYFMIKVFPLSSIILTSVCFSLFFQNVSPKVPFFYFIPGFDPKFTTGYQLEQKHKQKILVAKSFTSFLEIKYGHKTNILNKWVYIPFPYDQTMKSPFYGYVKNSYSVDHWRFFEEPNRYGIVALVQNEIKSIPYNKRVYEYLKKSIPYDKRVYEYLRKSHSFTEQHLPVDFEDFILFIHKDVLSSK